jgi:predicted histone-like DNA-binding protein
MPIYYRTYQSQSQDEKKHGKWYAHAQVMQVVGTREISEEIQQNVSVKRSDVIAVLAELSNVIKNNLQAGNRVKLDDIGSFKVNIMTKGAISAEKFGAENILGTKVIFQPESYKSNTGHRIKRWMEEIQVKELPKNAVGEE